jgi:hypothetical protein
MAASSAIAGTIADVRKYPCQGTVEDDPCKPANIVKSKVFSTEAYNNPGLIIKPVHCLICKMRVTPWRTMSVSVPRKLDIQNIDTDMFITT